MAISTDEAGEVKFKRSTTEGINTLPIENGSLIYNTENGKSYMDYNGERIQTGGNADTMIAIGGNEPTDDDIKIWIEEKDSQNYNTFNYRNSTSSNWENLNLPPTGDTLPIGAIVEYSGSTIPYGWEQAGTGKIRKIQESVGVVGTVSGERTNDNSVVYNAPYINGQTGTLLWTNPNPNSAMSSGFTINLSAYDYDVIEVFYSLNVDTTYVHSTKSIINRNIRLVNIIAAGPVYRNMTENNKVYTVSGVSGSSTDTKHCVPLYIIGYKTGLFD